jgi:predicted small metal-binding protein
MMKLACKDIDPDMDCHFEATGNTANEVAKKMLAHAKMEHSDKVKGMSDPEIIKMFETKAHS